MPYYSTVEELLSAMNKKVNNILKTDMVPVATDIVKEHIQTDIYDAYTPVPGGWIDGTTYQRRYVLPNTLFTKYISVDEALITSNGLPGPSVTGADGRSFRATSFASTGFAPQGAGSFFRLIEGSNHGIWRRGFPRPAITNAQKEIDSASGKMASAIRNGIKREFG